MTHKNVWWLNKRINGLIIVTFRLQFSSRHSFCTTYLFLFLFGFLLCCRFIYFIKTCSNCLQDFLEVLQWHPHRQLWSKTTLTQDCCRKKFITAKATKKLEGRANLKILFQITLRDEAEKYWVFPMKVHLLRLKIRNNTECTTYIIHRAIQERGLLKNRLKT